MTKPKVHRFDGYVCKKVGASSGFGVTQALAFKDFVRRKKETDKRREMAYSKRALAVESATSRMARKLEEMADGIDQRDREIKRLQAALGRRRDAADAAFEKVQMVLERVRLHGVRNIEQMEEVRRAVADGVSGNRLLSFVSAAVECIAFGAKSDEEAIAQVLRTDE